MKVKNSTQLLFITYYLSLITYHLLVCSPVSYTHLDVYKRQISNIEVVARTTKEFAKEMMTTPEVQGVSQTELANGPELPDGMTGVATLQDKKGTQKTKEVAPPPPPAPVKSATVNDSVVFEVVEEMPDFPGGQSALMELSLIHIYLKDLGTYAAWKATKTTGQFDLKTFEVKASPMEKVENLRPGMSVIINK